jgi:hypothetical protein
VAWSPNAPEAVLVSGDLGRTVLALAPHPQDPDRRHVVLVWTGSMSASVSPPNDEAISSHRLYGSGLSDVPWIGVVENSELVASLAGSSAVGAERAHVHHVLPLKECVVEVVAATVAVERGSGTTTLVSACRFAGR